MSSNIIALMKTPVYARYYLQAPENCKSEGINLLPLDSKCKRQFLPNTSKRTTRPNIYSNFGENEKKSPLYDE